MKAIAEMLKKLGPKYYLSWRMEYFGPDRTLIMTLVYQDPILGYDFKHQYSIPFSEIENMDKYGEQILYDMHRAIQDKKMEAYAKL